MTTTNDKRKNSIYLRDGAEYRAGWIYGEPPILLEEGTNKSYRRTDETRPGGPDGPEGVIYDLLGAHRGGALLEGGVLDGRIGTVDYGEVAELDTGEGQLVRYAPTYEYSEEAQLPVYRWVESS